MLYYSEAFNRTFERPVVGDIYTAEFEIPYHDYSEYEICIVIRAYGTAGNWAMITNKWIVRTSELYPDSLYLDGTTAPYDDWSIHGNGATIDIVNPAIVKPLMGDYNDAVFHVSVPVKIAAVDTDIVYAAVDVKYVINKYRLAHS